MADRLAAVERETLVQTFRKYDVDGSNSIDIGELEKVMEHLGVCMNKQQLQELVEQVDVNTNGELEFDEFCQLITMWRYASKFKLFDAEGMESLSKVRMDASLRTALLRPDSWGHCASDAVVAAVACAYWIAVLLDDVEVSASRTWFTVIEIVATVVFAFDFAVSCVTATLAGQMLLDSIPQVLKRYLTRWMLPDIVAAIPWGLMVPGTAGRVLRHVRLLKVFKIPFLWQPSGRVPINANRISFHFKLLPIALIVVQFVIMCHTLTVGFIAVKQAVSSADGTFPYDAALYYVVYTLYTVGNGDIRIDGPYEKAYACLVLVGTIVTNAFITGKLVSIMQKADIHQDRTGKLRETLAALQQFKIPGSLQDEVLQFQDHLLAHSLSASYASIVEGLPEEMQLNISLFVKLRLIASSPHLERAHYIVKVAIAEALANSVVLPEQYVQVLGEPVTTMYFIAHGFVDVFTAGGVHVATLHNNDHPYFGESALFRSMESAVSVKALTYCDLWGLHRSELTPLLKRFPRFKRLIRELTAEFDAEHQSGMPTGEPDVDSRSGSIATAVDGDGSSTAHGRRATMSNFVAWEVTPPAPAGADGSGAPAALPAVESNGSLAVPEVEEGGPRSPRSLGVEMSRHRRSSLVSTKVTAEEKLENILERLTLCSARMERVKGKLRAQRPAPAAE